MNNGYYRFEYVNNKAADDKDNTVYIDNHNGFAWLRCPCGCGEMIILNLTERTQPRHVIIPGGTISPVIKKMIGCRTEFVMIKNRVRPVNKYGKKAKEENKATS